MLLDCCLLVAELLFDIKPTCLTNLIRIGKTREVRLEYDYPNAILSLCTMLLYVIKFYIQGQVWLWFTDAWAQHASKEERGVNSYGCFNMLFYSTACDLNSKFYNIALYQIKSRLASDIRIAIHLHQLQCVPVHRPLSEFKQWQLRMSFWNKLLTLMHTLWSLLF
jgi:hypothetical protein